MKITGFCEAGKHEKLKPEDVKIPKTKIRSDLLNYIMILELELPETASDFFKKTVKNKYRAAI